ncbi:MAG TPA: bile acid:sodium symporter, partial [Thioalkalivibrio sp.]|nr:bile acid:sodium symporter [Thioalkalivibrio sp.]
SMNLESLLPIIVVLMMTIVGTEISQAQLTASLRMRRALVGGTLGQLVLLPVLAVLVVWLLNPPPALAGGLLLVAVSPGGVLSNYYCSVARLNVAFSITLTTVSGFVALAAMPLLFAAVVPAALGVEAFGVPVGEMTARLLLFLLLPVAVGMTLRHFFPAAIERGGRWLRASGLGLLVFFLALVFFEQRDAVVVMFGDAIRVTVAFTLLALIAGWLSGSLMQLNRTDRAVLAIEFGVRNVGIAALLALTTFQQPEFAAFGALFVLLQAPVLILALLLRRQIQHLPAAGPRIG